MKRSPNEIKLRLEDNLLSCETYDNFEREVNNEEVTEIEYVDSFGNEEDDTIYIFKKGNETLLCPSDDELEPILGTWVGEYDENNMPESFKCWMEQYAEEIELYQKNPDDFEDIVDESYKDDWVSVDKLLPFTFSQGAPYNNNLSLEDANPSSSTYGKKVKVVTGCSNTAFSQVIAYWGCVGINGIKYRVGSQKTTAFTSNKPSTGEKYICPSLPAIDSFDYDNIIEHYNTYYDDSSKTTSIGIGKKITVSSSSISNAQKNAVAQLMQYVGFNSQPEYGTNSTGTAVSNTTNYAKKMYFNSKLSSSTSLVTTSGYNTPEKFQKAVYNEIVNKRPVMFFGWHYDETNQKSGGGHAFNCDGYDKDKDMFHFNWGWNGQYNGWFSLSSLIYKSGQTKAGGFNYSKRIIANFYPQKFIEDVVSGDFNGDGTIDINDVMFLTNMIDTNNVIPAYDINGDGYVDINDVQYIMSKLKNNTRRYKMTINGNDTIDDIVNESNYDYSYVNINNNICQITRTIKTENNDPIITNKRIQLPTISNIKTNLQSLINSKSSSIQSKFTTYLNNKSSNDPSKNALAYLNQNKSKYVDINQNVKPAPNNDPTSITLVDLGLSVKWADRNIGANSITDAGSYYAWGETKVKSSYAWNTYEYYVDETTSIHLGVSISKSQYDVAYKFSNNLCMPTEDQFEELIDICTWKQVTKNNVTVWEVKGPNGNVIYFPINGCKSESSSISYPSYGYYWTSTYYSPNSLQAMAFRITDAPGFFNMYKRTGAGIRAVSI